MRARDLLLLIAVLTSCTWSYGRGRSVALASGGDDPSPYPTNQFYVTPSGLVLMFPNPDEFGAMAPTSSSPEPVPLRSEPVRLPHNAIVISSLEEDDWRLLATIPSDAGEVSDSFVAADGGPIIRVTWCEDGRTVKVAHLLNAAILDISTASAPDELASRPSVSRHGAVAYQRSAGDRPQVVFAERVGDQWSRQVVADVPSEPAADVHVQVHELAGAVWMDWVHDNGVMGYAVRDPATGVWSSSSTLPYAWLTSDDSQYVAREMARVTIRQIVIAGSPRSQN